MARSAISRLARRRSAFSRLRRRAQSAAARVSLRRSRGNRRRCSPPSARACDRGTAVFAAGVSLGGSALLNWLGRAGATLRRIRCRGGGRVRAARPHGVGHRHRQGLQPPIYARHFLRTLKPKALAMARALSRPARRDARRAAHGPCGTSTTPSPRRCTASPDTDDYWTRGVVEAVAARDRAADARAQRARTIRSSRARRCPAPSEVSAAVTLEQPAARRPRRLRSSAPSGPHRLAAAKRLTAASFADRIVERHRRP